MTFLSFEQGIQFNQISNDRKAGKQRPNRYKGPLTNNSSYVEGLSWICKEDRIISIREEFRFPITFIICFSGWIFNVSVKRFVLLS